MHICTKIYTFFSLPKSDMEKEIYLAWAELRVTLLRWELGKEPEELHSVSSLALGLFLFDSGGAWLWAVVTVRSSSSSPTASALGPLNCHGVPQRGQTRPPWNTRDLWTRVFRIFTDREVYRPGTLRWEKNFLEQYWWIRAVQFSFWHISAYQKQPIKAWDWKSLVDNCD